MAGLRPPDGSQPHIPGSTANGDVDPDKEYRVNWCAQLQAEYDRDNERFHQILLSAAGLSVVVASIILSFGELFAKARCAAIILSLTVLFCGLSGCLTGISAFVSQQLRAKLRRLMGDLSRPFSAAEKDSDDAVRCGNCAIFWLNLSAAITALIGALLFGIGVFVAALIYK